jgi:hypothetical protein
MISDSVVTKFRRPRSSSARLSCSALLPGRATNAWAVRASVDDVSTLGRVVWTMDATANALPLRMVKTLSGFWPQRLLRRRWPLRIRRSPAGQESLRTGKLDSPKCQTRPSGFPEDSSCS